MKFDFVVGNPPYQDETIGENQTFAPPIYHSFLDSAYEISNKAILIHPARFLFNAGNTPKQWNKKMLTDVHFKIIKYYPDVSTVFPNTNINGGVVVSYRDKDSTFGGIKVFTAFDEMNSILHKTISSEFVTLQQQVVTRTAYRLTQLMHNDHPNAVNLLSNGHAFDMASNIFEKLPFIFFDKRPNDGLKYIRILGRENGARAYKYIRSDYVKHAVNLNSYKVVMSGADGAAGSIGKPIPARVIGVPSVESPGVGTTESFISIGNYDSEQTALNCLKYVKSKFARTLLSVKKVTQAITPEKWQYVPLQDFTPSSDIDWSLSIPEIDKQLYKKYGLDEKEIEFIETHVKEMT